MPLRNDDINVNIPNIQSPDFRLFILSITRMTSPCIDVTPSWHRCVLHIFSTTGMYGQTSVTDFQYLRRAMTFGHWQTQLDPPTCFVHRKCLHTLQPHGSLAVGQKHQWARRCMWLSVVSASIDP